ncbi:H(+)/Cl(-) exchange transporter 5 [Psilocybe cubensis]|uniref:Chloride channel protein n=2 Tax=Psilocybe cubensis TaxID=181762 RepID=A0A8H8CPG8_PSICU|nr:H(+)/Cl(-) exchange transporter 5 [Psilocybe cubensis]KAH9485429.1 H(+)/Cl(-) exchange transporter 5 [Psilocybe cubensis]
MASHQGEVSTYLASLNIPTHEAGSLAPTSSSRKPLNFYIDMPEPDSPVDMDPQQAPDQQGRSAPAPYRANSSPIISHTEASTPTERTHLETPNIARSYGTLPTRRRGLSKSSTPRRNLSQLPTIPPLQRTRTSSFSHLPFTTSPFRDLSFARLSTRPISSYDEPLHTKDGIVSDADAKVNGIRVWYTSFTSIDWLHDAIKDSARFSKLRRRQSIRSRLRLAFDKSLGWIIVTIVGFLTAIVAFLVVRSEQLLFDMKEGYCLTGWWKARRFCCPTIDNGELGGTFFGASCLPWKTWSEVLSPRGGADKDSLVEYASYACIAITLAATSCLLTIYLTNSTTFVTRKESGSGSRSDNAKGAKSSAEPKRKVMFYAAGSGIPEIKTILSGFVIHGYLGGRTLFTKSVGLALSVASGLSLGKEGPFVHIASCVGNIVSRITTKYENNEAKRREILSASCAAGVAVAFGAPIGGTLFSLEEVSYFFPPKVMWRSFFCAMIAAITLKILDPFGTGKLVLFQVTYDKDWHAWELFPFVILGVIGGIYGAYFSKLNYHWSKNVRNKTFLASHPIVEVLLITLVTSVLCFLNPYTRMGGTELIYNLFAECRTGSRNTHSGLCIIDPGSFTQVWPVARSILVAMLVKAGLTVVTFGIKLPAGIFIPTLGVGACAGRVMGIAMQWIQTKHPNSVMFNACGGDMDCIIPGLYAMVGAAATLSGVTRTTVSLAVIMFELTDTLTYAVPVMLSVLVAKTVADALEPKGIYDLVIELNQLPYLDSKHEYLWGNLQINDVMYRDADVIRVDKKNTVSSLKAQVMSLTSSGSDDGGFPLVRKDINDDGYRMVGYIGLNELEHALALVSDDSQDEVQFHTAYSHPMASSSISSLQDSGVGTASSSLDPFDFTPYMDQAPLTLVNNSPMELVHQVFVKLGARYVIVTDTDGLYEGVIDKKTWLAFLTNLEEKS